MSHPSLQADSASAIIEDHASFNSAIDYIAQNSGVVELADIAGTARINFKLMEEYIYILRRLWRLEFVCYEGQAGRLMGHDDSEIADDGCID